MLKFLFKFSYFFSSYFCCVYSTKMFACNFYLVIMIFDKIYRFWMRMSRIKKHHIMEYDNTYPGILLSSFNEMRKANVMCDFTIKAGNESFNVHSVVLAAASKYFTAMFSSKMKEVQQAFVDTKFLNVLGVRQCIQYMYTGGIEPKMESVQHTLEASALVQLDGLTSICFRFLKNNLSVDTCLSALNFSRLHGRDDVSKLAENCVLKNFEAVTLTEMFPLISKSDLLHYIEASNTSHCVKWQAVIRWFSVAREESGKLLTDVLKSIGLPEFPFQFLLETVLNEPLLKVNDNCTKVVIDSLFKDVDSVKTNLSTENFFVLKKLTKSQIPNSEKISEAVDDYLAEHFEKLTEKDEFNNLEKDEIVSLFQAPNIKCSLEETKWNAALKWTKYDQRHRKKVFVKLFKLINLEQLSLDFIDQTVRNETLVKEFHECKDILLDMFCARCGRESKKDEQTLVPHIACLNIDNGNIRALELTTKEWKNLPSVSLSKCSDYLRKQRQIVNVCNEIYCLDFEKVVKFDQKEMKWIQKQSHGRQPGLCVEVVVVQKRIYCVERDVMACYDTIDNSWRENLPGCGLDSFFCAASSDKFIYTMGGCKNRELTADAKQYDLVIKSFSQITSMSAARSGASAAVFHEMVYVVGGYNGHEYLNSVEIYNPLLKSWSDVKGTCVGRWLSSSCVPNNTLYVFGGATDEIGIPLNPNSIEVYEEEANEWKIVKEYNPTGQFTPCCAVNLHCDKNE